MFWERVLALRGTLKLTGNPNLIHRTPYRSFGKSISRNQSPAIDRSALARSLASSLTRSNYKVAASAMAQRSFVTTNVLEKGSISKISNNANPSGPMLAIRREDASIWERRSPLAPFHVRKLVKKGVRVLVQPSNRRAYPLQAYVNAGAFIQEDISDAPVIIGVKQVPIDHLLENKTYVFFSHTIKAQEDNMAMLDACLDRNIRLIDYERMVNEKNQRVVAFGHYAGIAGMINILHGIGLRLLALGHHTPFMHIGPAHNYRNSGMARQAVRDCGYEIALGMMPRSIGPLTFVFTGSGNVSQGAQEIFQELPYEYVDPRDLPQVTELGSTSKVYATVVSRDDHLVRRDGQPFDADDYENNPERYYSNFATNIAPFASVIVNGIYWAVNSPRLLTIPDAKRLMQPSPTPWLPSSIGSPALPHRLLAICDISADPNGSIEFMTECTTIDTPFCLYDSDYNKHNNNNFSGPGVLVCSVDNMPTQLPLESTNAFGDKLFPYINDIINSDANKPFEEENFGHVVKSAVICSNGSLTPNFEYIAELRKRKSLRSNAFSEKKKNVLVLGSGYVAGPLVEYFTRDNNINVTICSALQTQTEQLANSNLNCNAVNMDVSSSSSQLDELIGGSDLVVSLLPYSLHPMIARKCIEKQKNMITASYTSQEMADLDEAAKEAGITILNEVGLDPGIDHLLAMECFDQVRKNNGKITSFISFCGGLPAPENCDNMLGYKFSWNPKGVLLASMNGAKYLKNNEVVQVKEGTLLDNDIEIDFLHGFNLEGYANRDSLLYKDLYGISTAHTCLRGTLRYRGFCDTMKVFQQLKLISDEPHPSLHPRGPEITWRAFIATLLGQKEDILLSNLKNVLIDRLNSETRVSALEELGLLNDELINKKSTPLETITTYLQNRLAFGPDERDLILMRHEVRIEWPNGKEEQRNINLVVYGEQNLERSSKTTDGLSSTKGFSAMAKTVGYPAAIAGQMVLNGEIQKKGCIMPFSPEIYHPMLKRLQQENIVASESVTKLN